MCNLSQNIGIFHYSWNLVWFSEMGIEYEGGQGGQEHSNRTYINTPSCGLERPNSWNRKNESCSQSILNVTKSARLRCTSAITYNTQHPFRILPKRWMTTASLSMDAARRQYAFGSIPLSIWKLKLQRLTKRPQLATE